MAANTLPVASFRFSTHEDHIEYARRRGPWKQSIRESILEDQAAIEQAREELGPDADAQDVVIRAHQIKTENHKERA